MSEKTKEINIKDPIDWLEKSIVDGHISYYNYSGFKNFKSLGSGSYGSVVRANWKNVDGFFALKTFNNDKITLKEVVNEIKLQNELIPNNNILKFCGITKIETENKCSLVLEYADSASAVAFLHECDIIHRDLHSENVLVHQEMIKYWDFNVANFERKLPFSDHEYDLSLSLSIINGKREKIIDGTPINYNNLYTKCWEFNLDKRPNMQEVVKSLTSDEHLENNNNIVDNSLQDSSVINDSSNKSNSLNVNDSSNKSNNSSNKNIELDINDYLSNIPNVVSSQNHVSSQSNQLIILENNQSKLTAEKKHENTERHNHLFLFQNNNIIGFYENRLGCLYHKGIGTETNKVKAFELYKIAAEKGHTLAQNNLGLLYQNGEGTEKDIDKAIYWFNKAAANGSKTVQYNLGTEKGNTIAQNHLGSLYIDGVDTEKDLEKAIYCCGKWDERSLYRIGECYGLGIGVNKNEIKAFEHYKKSAEDGYVEAKFILGYCYTSSIGTEINKKKGFELYNEAAGKKNSSDFDNNNDETIYFSDEIVKLTIGIINLQKLIIIRKFF
ncbi:kinase-like domain-containing protein [Rhizophagus clarus]|uniref:Kinase-like domain-containing protein n=1 Tax=Rhizophagus clarus TaxID=94130 RepID=A0A8H3R126_9GLOM|nr:kinase-like domain-containing protein [Rhizophagus clarus]